MENLAIHVQRTRVKNSSTDDNRFGINRYNAIHEVLLYYESY